MAKDLSHAPLRAVAARHLAIAEADVVRCEHLYESGAREAAYWCMLDLRASSSFRLMAGDRAAYIRAEAFVSLTRRLFDRYSEVHIVKELGDAVLVRSLGVRPLIEVACMVHMVADLWGMQRRATDLSLAARVAVTQGQAVELQGRNESDYVGAPLDRLARLIGVTVDADVVAVMDSDAYTGDKGLLLEYQYLRPVGPLVLDASLLKPGEPPTRYWCIHADGEGLASSRECFRKLRVDET